MPLQCRGVGWNPYRSTYEALEPLGWECVYANDFDPKKRAIYAARYPGGGSADFDGRDLFDVDPGELPRPVGLVAASFPCIDLSLEGVGRWTLGGFLGVRGGPEVLA